MRIRMSEYFQGTGVSAILIRTGNRVTLLEPDEEYEIDEAIGRELTTNRKAEQIGERKAEIREMDRDDDAVPAVRRSKRGKNEKTNPVMDD